MTAFLTVSSFGQSQLVGDLNSDYTVNVRDLQAFAWEWLSPGCLIYECGGDLDDNDKVNMADFALLANNWQKVEARMVISEFMASNASNIPLEEGELLDGNGESSDWIEIYNPTDTAVNLDGWYLTNNDSNLTKWQFPNGLEVEPGEFLIVFASDKTFELYPDNYPYLDSAGDYHTNFNLDKDEDYLALVASDGKTIAHEYTPQFPDQLTDISYGLAQYATAIVPKTAIASYHVPTSSDKNIGTAWTEIDFPDFSWNTQSTTNLHFGDICGGKGLNYEYFEGVWSYVPNFGSMTPLREGIVDDFDITPRLRDDYFGFRFTGFIELPLNGVYTFYTASDDGSELYINGSQVVYNDYRHDMEEQYGDIYLDAGMHSIMVDYFEYNGNHGLIVSYEGPGISKRVIPDEVLCSSTITNDMQNQMQYNNASLWTRIEFEVEDPHLFDMMVLQIRYEDGFVAYLNGQKVTWHNAPASVKWDSTALSNRPIEDSSVYEQINLMAYLDLLLPKPQKNVLAIQGLNDNEINDEFRILPVLITAKNRAVPEYFSNPTPGTFNISGAIGAVGDVWFSTERTFYNGPPDWHIDLTLSTGTDGAEIRYTDDGSCPTITHGLIYDPATDPPLEIDKTTIIRAVAVKPGWLDSKVETHTYIFLEDVIRQPFNPTDFPISGWGHSGPDYEMDPLVVNTHGASIKDDLMAVPTLSLTMDVDDWFGSDGRGIYPQES